jgi:hypothetical protein
LYARISYASVSRGGCFLFSLILRFRVSRGAMANCSMPSIGQILWGNRISPALDVLSLGMEKKEKKKKKFLYLNAIGI